MNLKKRLRQGAGLLALFGAVALVVWNMPHTSPPATSDVLTR